MNCVGSHIIAWNIPIVKRQTRNNLQQKQLMKHFYSKLIFAFLFADLPSQTNKQFSQQGTLTTWIERNLKSSRQVQCLILSISLEFFFSTSGCFRITVICQRVNISFLLIWFGFKTRTITNFLMKEKKTYLNKTSY